MILFCATDAAGARELRPIVRLALQKGIPCRILSSPVTTVLFQWGNILTEQTAIRSLEEARDMLEKEHVQVLIVGTTGVMSSGRYLTLAAKEKNIPSLAVLDEWYNYRGRFTDEQGHLVYLPDYVCVQDKLSKKLARVAGLPADIVRVTGSPSLAELFEQARLFAENPPELPESMKGISGRPVILFLSDVVRKTYGAKAGESGPGGPFLGYDEESVRNDLAEILSNIHQDVVLIEKLHPAEKEKSPPQTNGNVEWRVFPGAHALWPILWHADFVIGMSTRALLDAAFLGDKPISYQPNTIVDPELCAAVRFKLAELATSKTFLEQRLQRFMSSSRKKRTPFPSLPCADPAAAEHILDLALQASHTQRTVRKQHKSVEGKRLLLRTLAPEHATEEYASWINDPVVHKYLDTRSATVLTVSKYITVMHESDRALLFGIFWKENEKHIGNVKLEPIEWEKGVATLGILIGDKNFWGKGVATEAVNLAVKFAFHDLRLRTVRLGVISEHRAAIRVYEKCGFRVERMEGKAAEYDGVLRDRMWMRKDAAWSSLFFMIFGTILSWL